MNSYSGFIPSTELSVKQFEEMFDPSEIKPLLKYRKFIIGSTKIFDGKFFNQRIYSKYGEIDGGITI